MCAVCWKFQFTRLKIRHPRTQRRKIEFAELNGKATWFTGLDIKRILLHILVHSLFFFKFQRETDQIQTHIHTHTHVPRPHRYSRIYCSFLILKGKIVISLRWRKSIFKFFTDKTGMKFVLHQTSAAMDAEMGEDWMAMAMAHDTKLDFDSITPHTQKKVNKLK